MVRTQFNSLVETFIRMEILRPGSTGFPIEKSEFFTLSNLSSLEDLKWWKSNWKMGAPQRLYGMSTLSLVLAMEMISNIGIETYQRPAHRPWLALESMLLCNSRRVTVSPVRKGRSRTSCSSRHSGFLPIHTAADGSHYGNPDIKHKKTHPKVRFLLTLHVSLVLEHGRDRFFVADAADSLGQYR